MAAQPNTMPSGVIATGYPKLPNRRTALAALAGAGAALSLPKAARAGASPDAELIAHAAQTLALNARFDALDDRASTLDDYLMTHGPQRPVAPAIPAEPAPTVDHRPDGSFTVSMPAPARSPAETEGAKQAYAAVVAAHKAEREVYAERIGLRAVERERAKVDRRLKASVEALAAKPATTLQGVVAKARVSAAADPDDLYVTFSGLRASILRDLLTIGGDA